MLDAVGQVSGGRRVPVEMGSLWSGHRVLAACVQSLFRVSLRLGKGLRCARGGGGEVVANEVCAQGTSRVRVTVRQKHGSLSLSLVRVFECSTQLRR